jgi:TRAP-type C4-dicarboxylate transport system permease small subunit
MNLNKISKELSKWFCYVGGVALIGMLCIACANMLLRPLGHPYKGTYEIVGFLGALVFAFALGYAQVTEAHISVDILTTRYSKRVKSIVNVINSLLCLTFSALVTWQTGLWATVIWKSGEKSETLMVIYHPLIYTVAVCCFLLFFILFIDFLKLLGFGKGK